jgi:hypothetical protein
MDDNKRNEERITSILVDTSAFAEANSDFIGLRSRLLPAFFENIETKGILLITHPILDNEIYKHIEDSSIFRNYQDLVKKLKQCNILLENIGCSDEKLFQKIEEFDVREYTFETYKNNFVDAVRLPYVNAEMIFEKYFNSIPPFSSGKKKSEFPDAFVIEAVKQYLSEHTNEILLVVSKDSDWEKSFENERNVVICDSISSANNMLNSIDCILDNAIVEKLNTKMYQEMENSIHSLVESESYTIGDYEILDDVEIDIVEISEIYNYIPLKITHSSILMKVTVSLSVDGSGIILNEDNSYWDDEDGVYLFKSFENLVFTNGLAEIDCEVLLTYDFDNPLETVQLEDVTLNNNYCIELEVDENNIVFMPIIGIEDVKAEMMDALEEYYKH